jgi:hypothetical protein
VRDLRTFTVQLTNHAKSRVVIEMTATHPLSDLNPLWLQFHGLVRPETPTAESAQEVFLEAGLEPEREDWTSPRPGGFRTREDLVASVRRQLCLPAERDDEVAIAIGDRIVEHDGRWGFPPRRVVTFWWPGAARG